MKYSHLLTFRTENGTKYIHRSLESENLIPTVEEWNAFTEKLFGESRDWIVINGPTTVSFTHPTDLP